jgi:hypothetical protein
VAKVAVYVDGFNLYYGALKNRPSLKWLDLEALGRALAPGQHIVQVRYFTAWISGKVDPSGPLRQQTYLRALRYPSQHVGALRSLRDAGEVPSACRTCPRVAPNRPYLPDGGEGV